MNFSASFEWDKSGDKAGIIIWLQSYEDWLVERKFGDDLPPVLILDANQGIEEMKKLYTKHEKVIRGIEPFKEE